MNNSNHNNNINKPNSHTKHQKYIDFFSIKKKKNAKDTDAAALNAEKECKEGAASIDGVASIGVTADVNNKDDDNDDYYNDEDNGEYWGLGIENESYLMFANPSLINRNILHHHRRERYSVDYYKNYNMEMFSETIKPFIEQTLQDKDSDGVKGRGWREKKYKNTIRMPVYINGYMFQNVDIYGEHKTTYSTVPVANKKYCGMSIHEYMNYVSPEYKRLFKKNVMFDGDTIEFITSEFFKTTVNKTIDELGRIKQRFIREIDTHLSKKLIFKDSIIYPPYNHGFVNFMTNVDNLGICNSGTYHLNITLPTKLLNNNIADMDSFRDRHSNAVRLIQWMEPLLIALYGSPDILNTIDKCNIRKVGLSSNYCGGSLRVMMSRYIGLGTYDSVSMIAGKKLDDYDYIRNSNYFIRLHKETGMCKETGGMCYFPPSKIGYDINYNKFKNHGIELRLFDYFPEEYLRDVLNFIILLCEHSLYRKIDVPQNNDAWNDMAIRCIKNGSDATISNDFYVLLKDMFDIRSKCYYCCPCFDYSYSKTKEVYPILKTMNKISKYLYKKYVQNVDHYNNNPVSIIKKMSPDMKLVELIDYNRIIRGQYEAFIKTH